MKTAIFKRIAGPTGLLAMAGVCMVSIAALVATTHGASAAIKCDGQFQIIRGQGVMATPWCEDNYLAAIARTYGWKVSNRTVRQNPSVKARICRHIGHDGRVRNICSDHDEGNGFDRRTR